MLCCFIIFAFCERVDIEICSLMLSTVVQRMQIHAILISYYGLLTREPFSYSVVWVGIVPEPVEVHNKFSTHSTGRDMVRQMSYVRRVGSDMSDLRSDRQVIKYLYRKSRVQLTRLIIRCLASFIYMYLLQVIIRLKQC